MVAGMARDAQMLRHPGNLRNASQQQGGTFRLVDWQKAGWLDHQEGDRGALVH